MNFHTLKKIKYPDLFWTLTEEKEEDIDKYTNQ